MNENTEKFLNLSDQNSESSDMNNAEDENVYYYS